MLLWFEARHLCHLNIKWLTCSCVRAAITTYMSRSSCSRGEAGKHTFSIWCLPWPETTAMIGFIIAQRNHRRHKCRGLHNLATVYQLWWAVVSQDKDRFLHIYSTTRAHILGNSGLTFEKRLQVEYPSSFDYHFTWRWSPVDCQLQVTYCHCVLQ